MLILSEFSFALQILTLLVRKPVFLLLQFPLFYQYTIMGLVHVSKPILLPFV